MQQSHFLYWLQKHLPRNLSKSKTKGYNGMMTVIATDVNKVNSQHDMINHNNGGSEKIPTKESCYNERFVGDAILT